MTARFPDGGYGTQCLAGGCNLVSQEPCTTSQKCAYVANPTAARACVANGTVQEDGLCNQSTNDCARGMICLALAGSDAGSRCLRFCNSSADCGAKVCSLTIAVAGSTEIPLLCAPPAPACNPLTQSCLNGADGCYLSTSGASCYPAGTTDDGQPCASANNCRRGSTCINTGANLCRRLCNNDGGTPSCPSGACTRLAPPAPTDVGVCI